VSCLVSGVRGRVALPGEPGRLPPACYLAQARGPSLRARPSQVAAKAFMAGCVRSRQVRKTSQHVPDDRQDARQ
jgi:hypothetical protein